MVALCFSGSSGLLPGIISCVLHLFLCRVMLIFGGEVGVYAADTPTTCQRAGGTGWHWRRGVWPVKWIRSALVTIDTLFVSVCGGIPGDTFLWAVPFLYELCRVCSWTPSLCSVRW